MTYIFATKSSRSQLKTSGMHAFKKFCCVITDVLPTDFIHQSILQRQERNEKDFQRHSETRLRR